jgi:hypothetical protein
MVILKIDIMRVFTQPTERDPLISGDAHGPSPRGAVQTMESIACNVHVLWLRCHFQRLKDTHALPDIFGADPASFAGEVDLFKPFISEACDHTFYCKPKRLQCQLFN